MFFLFFFSFFLPFFPSSVCAAFSPSCPGHTGNWEGADFILRQLPGPLRKNPRYRAGSILQLRDDAFAALTRVGTRLFLPEQNMPLFPPKKTLPLEIWRLFSALGHVIFIARDAGYPSLLPRELVDASSLEVSFGQVFACPSCWILSFGGFSCAFSQFCPNLVFQIAHKAASSS